MAKSRSEPTGRAAAKSSTKKAAKRASETSGKSPLRKTTSGERTSKTLSPVTGRFVTRESTTQGRKGASAPALKPTARRTPSIGSAKRTPGAKGRGSEDATGKESFIIEVSTGSGKSEVFELNQELRKYRDALIAQLDDVVLPGVLARILKGAASIAPADLARRMLAVAPAPAPVNKMAEQVGPEYFDTNGVATILAKAGSEPVSKQAIEHRRRRHTILALSTSDGRWIYPTWQFRDHEVLPGLADVLTTFHAATVGGGGQGEVAGTDGRRSASRVAPFSEWSVATWLTTTREDLDGLTAIEWLATGRDRGHLLTLVRRTAAAWAA